MIRGVATLALLVVLYGAADAGPRPDFAPTIGGQIDLAAHLTDETGRADTLGYYAGGKPSLLLFGYHRCPNLCGVAELDLAQALEQTGMASDAYRVVFVSVDPAETSADAAQARDKLRQAAGTAVDLTEWRFLVGDTATLSALESSIGLTVAQNERDLYVHPIAVSALTADGRISGALSGLDYAPTELRQLLADAAAGRLGTLGDRVLLFCSAILGVGRYNDIALWAARIVSVAAMVALAGLVIFAARRRAS